MRKRIARDIWGSPKAAMATFQGGREEEQIGHSQGYIAQEAERRVERKENQVAVGRGKESGTVWNLEWWMG